MATGDRLKLVMQDDIGSPLTDSGVAAQQQIAVVWSDIARPTINKDDFFVYNKALYRSLVNSLQTPNPGVNCTKVFLGNYLQGALSVESDARDNLDLQVMELVDSLASSRDSDFNVAQQAHAAGSYFMLGTISTVGSTMRLLYSLYKATSNIEVGDAYVTSGSGQNCEAVTVGDELSAKAPLASPALTGNPTAPTQSAGNNSTRIATTAFVQREAGNSVAPLFSSSDSYAVDAYVMYGGALYRCTTAHTGAWDASHFTAVTVGGEIASYLPTLFAPAGFGWGESLAGVTLDSNSDLNSNSTFPKTMTFRFNGASVPQNMPSGVSLASGGFGAGIAISAGSSGTVKLVLMGVCPTSSSSPTIRLFSRWLLSSSRTDWKEITLA